MAKLGCCKDCKWSKVYRRYAVKMPEDTRHIEKHDCWMTVMCIRLPPNTFMQRTCVGVGHTCGEYEERK